MSGKDRGGHERPRRLDLRCCELEERPRQHECGHDARRQREVRANRLVLRRFSTRSPAQNSSVTANTARTAAAVPRRHRPRASTRSVGATSASISVPPAREVIEKTAGDPVGVAAPARRVTGAREVESTNRSPRDGERPMGSRICSATIVARRIAGRRSVSTIGSMRVRRGPSAPAVTTSAAGPSSGPGRSATRPAHATGVPAASYTLMPVCPWSRATAASRASNRRAAAVASRGAARISSPWLAARAVRVTELVRARVEPLLGLRFDAGNRFAVRRAEAHALERPAGGSHRERGNEARANDSAERR